MLEKDFFQLFGTLVKGFHVTSVAGWAQENLNFAAVADLVHPE